MSKMTFQCKNPDEIDYTMKITMPMSQWRDLKAQLGNDYPAWGLSSKITDLIIEAETLFYSKED